MMRILVVAVYSLFLWMTMSVSAQEKKIDNKQVTIVGKMRDVMWKGQLAGNIHLDTIAPKAHLYAIGPVEYLTGEILVLDGRAYRSFVTSDTSMKVEETFDVKAPFLGYAHIEEWEQHLLPDSVCTISELEAYLDRITVHAVRPFLFRVSGKVARASIHVVNLPSGAVVRSPEEAHRGMVHYSLINEPVDILGFFSTDHQTIFTHHDTYLHMHLITADRQQMGHVDDLVLEKGSVQLYLPK